MDTRKSDYTSLTRLAAYCHFFTLPAMLFSGLVQSLADIKYFCPSFISLKRQTMKGRANCLYGTVRWDVGHDRFATGLGYLNTCPHFYNLKDVVQWTPTISTNKLEAYYSRSCPMGLKDPLTTGHESWQMQHVRTTLLTKKVLSLFWTILLFPMPSSHLFQYMDRPKSNNVDTESRNCSWKIDSMAPVVGWSRVQGRSSPLN